MDDEKIIELYWRRDETAIARTDEKYGRLCRKISDDILSSARTARSASRIHILPCGTASRRSTRPASARLSPR